MPSEKTIERVMELTRQGANLAYFFDNLKSPVWIRPLLFNKFFRRPPEPVIEEGGTCWYSRWPESAYLARVASLAPADVLEAIRNIPKTGNYRVHEDIVDAAIAMPAKEASYLAADRIDEWQDYLRAFGFPLKLAKLAKQLVQGGEASMGLAIAGKLLRISTPINEKPTESTWSIKRTSSAVSDYEYEEMLRALVDVFSATVGLEWIRLLSDELEKAIGIERGPEGQPQKDHSYLWFSDIEQTADFPHEIRSLLAVGLRDSCRVFIENKKSEAQRLFDYLLRRNVSIFRRIVVFVIATNIAEFQEMATTIVKTRDYFEDEDSRDEYHRLVTAAFPNLTQDDREMYLAMVREYARPALIREKIQKFWGRAPDDDDVARECKLLQLRRLHGIQEFLPEEWRTNVDQWTAEFGEAQPVVRLPRSPVCWANERSPKTPDELVALSNSELFNFLRTWKPGPDWDGPSESGLVSALSSVIQRDPRRFVGALEDFKNGPRIFWYAALMGFQAAAKQGADLDWKSVLDFSLWALSRKKDFGPDEGYRGCCVAVLDLITSLIEGTEPILGIDQRSRAWQCVNALLVDSDPSPEREVQSLDSQWAPLTIAINSIRGKAVEATIRFALWVRILLSKTDPERAKQGFSVVPEAAEALDMHLHVERDPSIAIRSIISVWLPQLASLDPTWVRNHVKLIFPRDNTLRPYRQAAWDTYVAYSRPYTGVFELLKGEYLWATTRLSESREERFAEGNPSQSLAEHLLYLYGIGAIELRSDVMTSFWDNAPSELRASAISWTGRTLPKEGKDVNAKAIERLMPLCEWRLETAEKSKPEVKPHFEDEASEFGWWFGNGHFDFAWSLVQLKKALTISRGVIQGGKELLKRLADGFDSNPMSVLDCLALAIEGAQKTRMIDYWRGEITSILRSGVDLKSDGAKRRALQIRDRLLAMGYRHFLEIK